MENLNQTVPAHLDLTRKIVIDKQAVDYMHEEGRAMEKKECLNINVSDKLDNELRNVRQRLNIENNEIAAKLAISVLSDLIDDQKNGDEIILRRKKDEWGKKKEYRIDFQKEEAIVQ